MGGEDITQPVTVHSTVYLTSTLHELHEVETHLIQAIEQSELEPRGRDSDTVLTAVTVDHFCALLASAIDRSMLYQVHNKCWVHDNGRIG